MGHYQVTVRARGDAMDLGIDEQGIRDCICALTAEEFYKTAPSDKVPGSHQDVYKTWFCGRPIYTKLTLGRSGGRKTVVISFHLDESPQAPTGGKP